MIADLKQHLINQYEQGKHLVMGKGRKEDAHLHDASCQTHFRDVTCELIYKESRGTPGDTVVHGFAQTDNDDDKEYRDAVQQTEQTAERIKQMENDLSRNKSEIQMLKDKQAHLENELKSLEERHQASLEEIDDLQAKLEDAESRAEKFKNQAKSKKSVKKAEKTPAFASPDKQKCHHKPKPEDKFASSMKEHGVQMSSIAGDANINNITIPHQREILTLDQSSGPCNDSELSRDIRDSPN